MTPGYGEASALGALQGVTEFLPISSDGHLALAQLLFGEGSASLTLTVLLHIGTLFATVLVLRRPVVAAAVEGARAIVSPKRFTRTEGGRDALVVIIASVPTAAIGLALRDAVEDWTSSPLVIGIGFSLTAALLVSTRFVEPGREPTPTALGAFVIGTAQAFAVLPGLSRSGATIVAALWLGVRPQRAFELSMLMALPAVLGATILELRHAAADASLGPVLVGIVVAFVVGSVALVLLRGVVTRGRLSWFALWVVPLAIATLAFAKARPG